MEAAWIADLDGFGSSRWWGVHSIWMVLLGAARRFGEICAWMAGSGWVTRICSRSLVMNGCLMDRWPVAAPFVDGVGLLPSSLPHSMADRDQLGGFLPWAALDDGDRMRRTSDRAGSEMKTLLPFFWMGPIG
ncbi:hypothetical protein ACLOJK_036492 [Asimina triloba]